jgi:hypothetical protein
MEEYTGSTHGVLEYMPDGTLTGRQLAGYVVCCGGRDNGVYRGTRILAGSKTMSRGAKDDSNQGTSGTLYRLDDMAELAVRLGSPVKYQRSGTVLFLDDFTSGYNHWSIACIGAAGAYYLTNSPIFANGVALELLPGTGATPLATFQARLAYPTLSKIGLCIVHTADAYLVDSFYRLEVLDGAKQFTYEVQYHHADGILSYLAPDNTYKSFGQAARMSYVASVYHVIKLIVDLDLQGYALFLLNGESFSMAGLLPYQIASSGLPRVNVQGEFDIDGTHTVSLYVGAVVVTENEVVKA